MRREFVYGVVLAAGLVAIAGCDSGSAVKTVEVSGAVKMDSQPLAGAEVNFVAGQYAGIATTGADGQFKLNAQPGENKVYIQKYPEGYDPTMTTGSDTPGASSGPKQLVPEKYSDPLKSELKFTVPDGGANNADFQITSK
jgi:hypothetical protein